MSPDLLRQFQYFYSNLLTADLSQLSNFYANDVKFKSPALEVQGIVPMEDYFSRLINGLQVCRIEFLDQLISENSAYLKWHMYYSHPRFGDKRITVRGVSHLDFNDKIYYHENIYDMGQMLYEHIPGLGCMVKRLKRRSTRS